MAKHAPADVDLIRRFSTFRHDQKGTIMQGKALVEANELGSIGPVRLLDASGSAGPAAGGLAGVARVPIEEWVERAKRSATGLDDLGYWAEQIAMLGVGDDALTVVFDDGRMTEAARVWFILQYFGLPAAVLNGGVAALSGAPTQAPRATRPPTLRPGAGSVGLKSRPQLKGELGSVDVFDARTAAEYRGEDLKGNKRGGRLPRAANLSHEALLEGTRLKSGDEIARLMNEAGLGGSKAVVSHCNGGGRAALAALAAVVAGRSDVHVYYLSFADWAADESCPLERPADTAPGDASGS